MPLPRLRAPANEGELLAVPSLDQVPALLDRNVALLRPFEEERRAARAEVLDLARRYHREGGEPVPEITGGAWFVAGHQPELFHPGVWVKNFALAGLARRAGGVALNLIVDNDTIKSTAVRVPVRGDDWPHRDSVRFDAWHGEQPWEDRPVLDPARFASFPDRLQEKLAGWRITPLAGELWRDMPREGPLGERFVAARRAVERRWGCHNFEVPLSRVCETAAFGRFVRRIVADLPRFVAVYNAAAQEYRARHGIRNANHPVPDLARQGDWLEAPLWAWRPGSSRRARVFFRGTDLRAGDDAATLDDWRGLKVRSRALLTTLFARLCLADVFMHGIGGGKYDELTDAILRGFFGTVPPGYLILSATCRLPLPTHPATPEQRRALHRRLRDLDYNPERSLSVAQRHSLAAVIAERRRCLAGRGGRAQFVEQRRLLEVIRAPLADERQATAARLAQTDRELAANALLRRRDYSVCLYPEDRLRPFLVGLL